MLWMCLTTLATAGPIIGIEWMPLTRSDLDWVDDDRTSGLAVGEFDGAVRPNLMPFFGGWVSERVGLVGSIGFARLSNTTWTSDIYRQRHWGVVRPALDLRIGLTNRREGWPHLWLVGGLYGDIPSARDVSNGYTAEEQELADETALSERARLSGVGGRLGLGADLKLTQALSVGLQYSARYHRGLFRGNDSNAASTWLAGEASVLLTLYFPTAETPEEPEDEANVPR